MWIINYIYNDISKRLKILWFSKLREWKWSHEIWINDNWLIIVLPNRWNKNLSKWVIKEIINNLEMNNKEFKNLLKK